MSSMQDIRQNAMSYDMGTRDNLLCTIKEQKLSCSGMSCCSNSPHYTFLCSEALMFSIKMQIYYLRRLIVYGRKRARPRISKFGFSPS